MITIRDLLRTKEIDTTSEEFLTKTFNEHKLFFEDLLVKDFIGKIPKEVNEPVLKFFSDQSEMVQRWVLWQSHYLNRRALHDIARIPHYDGMMVYLKVLFSIAERGKKGPVENPRPEKPVQQEERPLVEKELEVLENFKRGFKNAKIQSDKVAESESNQDGKNPDNQGGSA